MMDRSARIGSLQERRQAQGLKVQGSNLAPPGRSRNRSCRIYFHVAYSEVEYPESEEVRVVGDHPLLGSWEAAKGLVLTTHEDIFPCWISSEPVFIPLHTQVKYKYAVMSKDGSLKVEEGAEREFTTSGPEMTIEDDEGLYRQLSGAAGGNHEVAEAMSAELNLARTPSIPNFQDAEMDLEQKLAFVKQLEGEFSITKNDTVFMFHFDLPVKVIRSTTSGGGWDVMDSPYSAHFIPLLQELKKQDKVNVQFIGWPGIHVRGEREQNSIREFLEDYNCIPVFPPQSDFDEFLNFCDNYLWPLFHDVISYTLNPPPFNEQGWASYQHINNIYANAIVSYAHDSDLIWVHDYQLMMMPTFISRKLARANIGFYLHAPFPSSDTFKSLPIREELLSGMLCADQVGFQFFTSVRNFVVTCKRIYGLDPQFRAGGFMGLDYNGRTVAIKVAHFGLPYEDTRDIMNSELVAKKTAEVRSLFDGKTMFVCQDRCRGLSGLTPKFRDFKRFLNEHPQHRGKVVLVQYCASSDLDETLMESLRRDADAIVHTNEETGALMVTKTGTSEHCDIFVRFEQHDREDRLALFRAGHVLLDTSVKAGLNLIPFDFITAHHDDSSKHSIVIVSEFSGCSRVLLGSLRINPWSSSEVMAACERALSMGGTERQDRYETNLSYTSDFSPVEWFEGFVADLRRARKKDYVRIESIGFGARIRPIAMNQHFQRLPNEEVMRSLFVAKRRVFFLDNEGTLAPDKRGQYREYGAPKGDLTQLSSHGTGPDEHVLECLRELTSDHRNTVVILSGRPREQLEAWFGSVPKIGLAAERGFHYKLPSVTGDQWQLTARQVDSSWKSYAFELMRQFVKRTQGAYIENKGSALVWQYRDADQHYGSWQAKELSSHLKELLVCFDVEVVEGKGYVEVKMNGINKGVAVATILDKVAKTFGEADFVLCCGDDRSDEDMFKVVNRWSDFSDKTRDAETSSQLSTTDDTQDGSEDTSDKEARSKTQEKEDSYGHVSSTGSFRAGMKKSRSPKIEESGVKSSMSSSLNLMGSSSNLMSSYSGNLHSLGGDAGDDDGGQQRFFTCVVGRKPSDAKFFLHDTDEMSELLSNLASQNKRRTSLTGGFHRQDGYLSGNSNTWSGGSGYGIRDRGASMPALNTLAFSGSPKPKSFGFS